MNTFLATFCDAAGSCFDQIYALAADQGTDGQPGYTPSWGALFDITQCPTEDLPYLGQYVGVTIPVTATDSAARQLIQAEAGLNRGTLSSLQSAIARNLSSVWTPNTAYTTGQVVSYQPSPGTTLYYSAAANFTSGSVFPGLPPENLVLNPSFEYDTVGAAPAVWTHNVAHGTISTFLVQNGWSQSGSKSLRVTTSITGGVGEEIQVYTPLGTSGMPVVAGQTYSAQATVDLLTTISGMYLDLQLAWFDSSGSSIGIASNDIILNAPVGVQSLSIAAVVAPPGAAYASVMVQMTGPTTSGTLDFYLDAVAVMPSATVTAYGDGDLTALGYVWSGTPGDSVSSPAWTQTEAPAFQIYERTPDPYQITIVVRPEDLTPSGDPTALLADIANVKPAGILVNIVQTDAPLVSQYTRHLSAITATLGLATLADVT